MSMIVAPYNFGAAAAPGDPYYLDVFGIFHLDSASGSVLDNSAATDFHDASKNSATIDTSIKKFGAGSVHVAQNLSQVITFAANSTPDTSYFAIGAYADFVLEWWQYVNSGHQQFQTPLDWRPQNTNGVYPTVYIDTTNRNINYYVNSADRINSANSAITLDVWEYIALARVANSTRLYVNGAQVGATYTDNNAYLSPGASGGYMGIGSFSSGELFGNIDEVRFTKAGRGYSGSTISVPTTPFPDTWDNTDPYISSVVLRTNCEGSNGATSITPSISPASPINRRSTATVSTSQFKFGTASLRCNGSSDSFDISTAQSDFGYGTGAFTLEMWIRPDAVNVTEIFFDQRVSGNGNFPTIYYQSNGVIKYLANSVDRITSSSGALTAAAWNFVAYSKQAGSAPGELSVNGTVVGSWTDTITYGNGALWLGGIASFATQIGMTGYFDECRITKGRARYSGNFVVPATAFPNS